MPAMRLRNSSQLMLLIMLVATLTSLIGITSKGIQCWDEGVYYTEARYLVQSAGLGVRYLWQRLTPGKDSFDLEQESAEVTGLPPRMGRPLNALVNATALALIGDYPWVPAFIAALAGLGCIYAVFELMRRSGHEATGLLAAGLLTASPYFLPYRRLGLPEALGALLAMLTVRLLVTRDRDGGRSSYINSCWLGCLCGLAFGANTRTLLLLPPMALWRVWHKRTQSGGEGDGTGAPLLRRAGRASCHGWLVLAGFAAVLASYQLPYLLLGWTGLPVELESYFQQLERFAVGQGELGGVGAASAYGATAYFLTYYEGPTLLLLPLGLAAALRSARWREGLLVLLSLLVLPLVQAALLIPYARYQSWLLPILAIIGAVGARQMLTGRSADSETVDRGAATARRTHLARIHTVLGVLLLMWIVWHSCDRGIGIMEGRSRHLAALEWARSQGAEALIDSNMSVALSHSPLYRLQAIEQLPLSKRATIEAIRRRQTSGRVMVIIETQQFMRQAVLMAPAEYEATAAAAIRRRVRPLWYTSDHLRGLFPFLCFEHNRYLDNTLQTLAGYQEAACELAIYDGEAVAAALEQQGAGAGQKSGKTLPAPAMPRAR